MWRDWKEAPLKSIANARKGELITEATAIHGNVPVIAGGMAPSYYHKKANRPANTITVSASGANAGYVGFHPYPIFASDCSTIEQSGDYDIKFLYYLLASKQSDITKMQAGGAQPHVYPENINNLVIFYPPDLDEQKAIAEVLDTVDEAITATQAMLDKQDKIKDGLLRDLVKESSDLHNSKALIEMADILYGKSPNEVRMPQGNYPIMGSSGVTGYAVRPYIVDNCVIVGRKGTLDNPIYVNQHCWPIDTTYAVVAKEGYITKWLYYCLKVTDLKKLNEATGVPSLNRDVLGALRFIVPKSQSKIVEILDSQEQTFSQLKTELTKLKKLKAGLMQDLLTGKKRISKHRREAA